MSEGMGQLRAAFARFNAMYKHLKGVGMSDDTECRHLPEPAWNPDRCEKCGALERRPGIAWTSDSPTVPGDYLCRYRFRPEHPWTESRFQVTEDMLPIKPDTSETLWFGPIPEIESAKGGGE